MGGGSSVARLGGKFAHPEVASAKINTPTSKHAPSLLLDMGTSFPLNSGLPVARSIVGYVYHITYSRFWQVPITRSALGHPFAQCTGAMRTARLPTSRSKALARLGQ